MKIEINGNWVRGRLLPGMGYAIALGLAFGGPGIFALGLAMAVVAGDPLLAGVGLIAGVAMGLVGALALMWCLHGSRHATGRADG